MSKPSPISTAIDIGARGRMVERARHASRQFGKPDVPSQAHSMPTVFIPHPRFEQEAFDGKANVATAPITGERQFIAAPSNMVTVYNATTHETQTVHPDEGYRLVKQGWHIVGVTDPKPRPVKRLGRL